jgi:hypothetical protein
MRGSTRYEHTYINVCELCFNLLACSTKGLEATHPVDLNDMTFAGGAGWAAQDVHDLSVDLNCGEQLLKTDEVIISEIH